MLEFETRGRYTNSESSVDVRIGNIFYGTEGYLELYGESAAPEEALEINEYTETLEITRKNFLDYIGVKKIQV
jgi:hypothetical protein